MAQHTTVNAVLGDTSWILSHNSFPTNSDSEEDRITTHLNYVVGRLKAREIKIENRKKAITHLETYIEQARYPSRFDYSPSRKPCFIDDEGTLCAVGYLVAQTAGLAEAQRINSLYRYNYIAEMDDPDLRAWQQWIGLSMQELAMIQPSYGSPPEWVVYKDPKKEQYGLKNRYTDKVIAKPIYDSLIFQYQRLMYGSLEGILFTGLARINNKWGAVNSKGETVVPIEYDSISLIKNIDKIRRISFLHFDTNAVYLQTYSNGVTQVFNHLGKKMFQLPMGKVAFRQKHLFIVESNGMQRFWDSRINKFVGKTYKRIQVNSYNQPKGFLVFNSGYGFVSEPENELIPCAYKSLLGMGNCWLAGNEKGKQLLSIDGQPIDIGPFDWAEIYGYTDSSKLEIWKGNQRGLFDLKTCKWLISADHDQIHDAHEGLIYAEKESKKGYYDLFGKVVVPIEYDNIRRVRDGYLVRQKGKMGLFMSHGNWTLTLTYDSIIELNNASISAYALLKNGKWSISTADGEAVFEQELTSFKTIRALAYVIGIGNELHFARLEEGSFQVNTDMSIQSLTEGIQGRLIYEQNGKYGFWTTYADNWIYDGKVTEAIYDEVVDHGLKNRGALPVKYKGKYGLVNREGNFMVPAIYQAIDHSHISILYFKGTDGWYRYDYGRPLQAQTPQVNQLLNERNK